MEAARLAFESGFFDEADALIAKSKALMDETEEEFSLSDLHRLQARFSLHKSDSRMAEAQLHTALEVARRQHAGLWELRASIDLARLWQEQKRTDEAISLLVPIHSSIDNGDCPEDQAIAKKLLAALQG